jgi:hypothetical protein
MHRTDADLGGSLAGAIRPKAKFALTSTFYSLAIVLSDSVATFARADQIHYSPIALTALPTRGACSRR